MTEPEDDTAAWRILEPAGYKCYGGMIYHPDIKIEETPEERLAINYLCIEWDYGFWKTEEAVRNIPQEHFFT